MENRALNGLDAARDGASHAEIGKPAAQSCENVISRFEHLSGNSRRNCRRLQKCRCQTARTKARWFVRGKMKGQNQEMIEDTLQRKRRTIIFYKEAANIETVLNWIRDLPQQDRSALGLDLDLVQSEWRIGSAGDSDGAPSDRVGRIATGLFGGLRRLKQGHPQCRKLENGLWELQSAMPSGKAVSLLFFVTDGTVHVVQGHIKKTGNVPPEILLLARQRMGLMLNGAA